MFTCNACLSISTYEQYVTERNVVAWDSHTRAQLNDLQLGIQFPEFSLCFYYLCVLRVGSNFVKEKERLL